MISTFANSFRNKAVVRSVISATAPKMGVKPHCEALCASEFAYFKNGCCSPEMTEYCAVTYVQVFVNTTQN